MCVLDLDDFDQVTDDFPAGGEVGLIEAVANLIGEIIQLAERKFMFDGGAGDDTFNASPLSVAEYTGFPLAKKVQSKILNFEHLL